MTDLAMTPEMADLVAARFRVIGDPLRIRILDLLRESERSVTDLTEELGTSQQNASKHLGILLQEGIVSRRKQGTSSMYKVADEGIYSLCEQVCGGIQQRVAGLNAIVQPA